MIVHAVKMLGSFKKISLNYFLANREKHSNKIIWLWGLLFRFHHNDRLNLLLTERLV
jgi:hypothetical protein